MAETGCHQNIYPTLPHLCHPLHRPDSQTPPILPLPTDINQINQLSPPSSTPHYIFASKQAGGLAFIDPIRENHVQTIVQALKILNSQDPTVSAVAKHQLCQTVRFAPQSDPTSSPKPLTAALTPSAQELTPSGPEPAKPPNLSESLSMSLTLVLPPSALLITPMKSPPKTFAGSCITLNETKLPTTSVTSVTKAKSLEPCPPTNTPMAPTGYSQD